LKALAFRLSLLLVLAPACATVLGFEPATEDPLGSTGGAAGEELEELPANAPLCERYCQVVMAACAEEPDGTSFQQYDSKLTCLRQCEMLEPGEPGAESGNSVECRLTSARVAQDFSGERSTACTGAGPGGDGACGENCESYCRLMAQQCPGLIEPDACIAECAKVPDAGGFNIDIVTGNSIQCRFYHLQAAVVSPTNHCPHAAGAYPCSEAR
jgi:hypothetical protein